MNLNFLLGLVSMALLIMGILFAYHTFILKQRFA